MQRHGPRHFTAYTITAVAYLLVVAFIYYTQSHHFVSSEEPKESVIKMSLSQFVPEVVTPPEPIIEKVEEPVEEKAVEEPEEEPEPVIEKEVIKEVVSEPVVKKVTPKVVKKPAKKKLVKKKVQKKRKTKKKLKKTLKKRKKIKQASSGKTSTKKQKVQANKSWPELQAKINKNKMYPRIAKKRRMEGSVEIKFTISSAGNVKILSQKGRKIFYKSARRAVEKAFPVNPLKAPIELPSTITLKLHYVLRRN